MSKKINRYRILCTTENNYVYTWNDVTPTVCPTNNAHTIDNSSISIIDSVSEYISYGDISTDNSTSTPLSANTSWTGTGEIVTDYSSISILTYSDKASIIDGLELQLSSDGTNWDRIKKASIIENKSSAHTLTIISKYFRIKYTNGSENQTEFRLQTIYHKFKPNTLSSSIKQEVSDDSDVSLTRAVLMGKTIGNKYDNIAISSNKALHVDIQNPLTSFGELRTSELYPQIQLAFPYNINSLIIDTNIIGSGTITQQNSLAKLQVTSSSSSCELKSHKTARYYPGQGLLCRFSNIFSNMVTGMSQISGMGNNTDGVYIGCKDTNFGIVKIKDSIEEWVYQTNFNIDKLDGNGLSGLNIDPTKGNVYEIQFQWLGFGSITFSVEESISGKFIPFHNIRYTNLNTDLTVTNPVFSVRFFIENTTNTNTSTMCTGSSAIFNEGQINVTGPRYYIHNSISNIDKTETHLLSLKNINTFNSKTNRNDIIIKKIFGSNDHSHCGYLYIYINCQLSGGTWENLDINNSISQINKTSSITTYGHKIGGMFIKKDDSTELDIGDIVLSPGDILTITCKESNGKKGIMSTSISWQEDL